MQRSIEELHQVETTMEIPINDLRLHWRIAYNRQAESQCLVCLAVVSLVECLQYFTIKGGN